MDIEHLAVLRGEKRLVPLLIRHGMPRARARQVEQGSKMRMMRDDTVRELCEILRCMPNDLFRWTGAETDPLSVLNKAPFRKLGDVLYGRSAVELERLWAEFRERDAVREVKEPVRGGRVWLNVRRLLEMRSTDHPARTLMALGFTETVARNLTDERRRDGQAYMKMPLLTKLCKALDCLPNDLYDFEGPEGHVLDGLRKTPVEGLDALMKRMTPEEIRMLLG